MFRLPQGTACRREVSRFDRRPGGCLVIGILDQHPHFAISIRRIFVYTATKGAVDAVTRVLAKELSPRKIRVNAIKPGLIDTEGTHAAGVIGNDFASCGADAARTDRTAGRYSAGRGVLGVGRVALGHRRYAGGFGGHWLSGSRPCDGRGGRSK